MQNTYNKLVNLLLPVSVKPNELLSSYTTLRIGGLGEFFIVAKTQDELVKAIKAALEMKLPYTVLGGGTNVLISDEGVKGLVIRNETKDIKMIGMTGIKKARDILDSQKTVFLEIDSGVGVNRLVRYVLDEGLSGLETFLGQPGTVGGAVYMNAHNMKWGTFFGDTIKAAKIITQKGEIKSVDASYFKFGYDSSSLQKSRDVLLSVIITLSTSDKDELWKIGNEVAEYRRSTQPWGVLSAGCTFQNIKKSDAMRIPTPLYTTSAGYLIESIGLKGTRIGGASVSLEHANFIVVEPQTKSSDVVQLIQLITRKVYSKYHVRLKPEVVYIP